ncbi:MAG: PIN domain-containing protein [Candidatus Methanodesulfokora sp.]|nr:MAG: hypothetical protein C0200_07130 [Candidatus Korarchaeota archaeon]
MILDTTYLLPLARIDVKTDFLKAVADGKIKVNFSDLRISLISIFEIQAKAFSLNVPPTYVIEAIDVIQKSFDIIPFYKIGIVERAHELRDLLRDYINCIIVATAIEEKEALITEDSSILSAREEIKKKYKIDVMSYRDFNI